MIWGGTENTPQFVGRVLGNVQLYGEREKVKRGQTITSILSGLGSLGGDVFYWAAPNPPPSDFQVLISEQSGSEISGVGDPSRAKSGAASQVLAGSLHRRAASEGSLTLMGREAPAPRGDRVAAREGENTSSRKRAVRGGQEVWAKGGSVEYMET